MSIDAADLHRAVAERLERLVGVDAIGRIWHKDPTLWTDDPSTPELADRLGWLTVGQQMARQVEDLAAFAGDIRGRFDRVVLLGMGGSSLAPEVLWRIFGPRSGFPAFAMLDSTHPAAVRAIEADGAIDSTLFIVSSKSGTTVETMSFYRYFRDRTGGDGARFVAITDPGTPLDELGRAHGFRRVFHNPADVGGRFSALSMFGLVPAALMGIDVGRLVEAGEAMARSCSEASKLQENPGAWLGALLGEAAVAGRDRLTFVPSPRFGAFGLWAEQLVAESTGKGGKGILPIVNEPGGGGDVGAYADDRVFVEIAQTGTRESGSQLQFRGLEEAGHPLVRIGLRDRYELGGEFFRWEFATAIAGMILGVNPFDQPNVALSKQITSRLLSEGVDDVAFAARSEVERLLHDVAPGHYVAIMVYLPPSAALDRRLSNIQTSLRDRVEATVTVGYGPRLLHSTGQLHKGGPPHGHFIQVLDATRQDVAIPGAAYTFGELIAAQALGDYEALHQLGRPVIRVRGVDILESLQ